MSDYTRIRVRVSDASDHVWDAANKVQEAWNHAADCGMLTSSASLYEVLQRLRKMADELSYMHMDYCAREENDDEA